MYALYLEKNVVHIREQSGNKADPHLVANECVHVDLALVPSLGSIIPLDETILIVKGNE